MNDVMDVFRELNEVAPEGVVDRSVFFPAAIVAMVVCLVVFACSQRLPKSDVWRERLKVVSIVALFNVLFIAVVLLVADLVSASDRMDKMFELQRELKEELNEEFLLYAASAGGFENVEFAEQETKRAHELLSYDGSSVVFLSITSDGVEYSVPVFMSNADDGFSLSLSHSGEPEYNKEALLDLVS